VVPPQRLANLVRAAANSCGRRCIFRGQADGFAVSGAGVGDRGGHTVQCVTPPSPSDGARRLDQRSLRVVLRFERGDTDIDSDDDQPAKQFGDIKWKLTSRVRGTIVRSFGGGDALWAFPCNNKLEKGVINTQGVSRFRDLADGVTLLRSTYAGAVVLPESRLPTHRDCSCRRAGVWRRGRG
jgi:hypothetical protein